MRLNGECRGEGNHILDSTPPSRDDCVVPPLDEYNAGRGAPEQVQCILASPAVISCNRSEKQEAWLVPSSYSYPTEHCSPSLGDGEP
jgi:hypothetical protein